MTFTYRRLDRRDAPAVRALRHEALTCDPRAFHSTVQENDSYAAADRLAEDFVIGAFDGEALVGMGGLSRDLRERLQHKMLLRGMYVTASARGRGVADAIIERLLDHARSEGVIRVLLTVMAENARARRVYARHGFMVYGVEPGAVRFGDEYLDDALMSVIIRSETPS